MLLHSVLKLSRRPLQWWKFSPVRSLGRLCIPSAICTSSSHEYTFSICTYTRVLFFCMYTQPVTARCTAMWAGLTSCRCGGHGRTGCPSSVTSTSLRLVRSSAISSRCVYVSSHDSFVSLAVWICIISRRVSRESGFQDVQLLGKLKGSSWARDEFYYISCSGYLSRDCSDVIHMRYVYNFERWAVWLSIILYQLNIQYVYLL